MYKKREKEYSVYLDKVKEISIRFRRYNVKNILENYNLKMLAFQICLKSFLRATIQTCKIYLTNFFPICLNSDPN